jgi:hypothetical protein
VTIPITPKNKAFEQKIALTVSKSDKTFFMVVPLNTTEELADIILLALVSGFENQGFVVGGGMERLNAKTK